MMTVEETRAVQAKAEQLVSPADIATAYDTMAGKISRTVGDSNPIVACVMNGGLIPTAQLLTRMQFPLRVEYIHPTRYRGGTHGGEIEWIRRPAEYFRDQVILVVDDIFDEGHTLQAAVDACRAVGAKRVYSAALVEKQRERDASLRPVDFIGVRIPDRYVFGSGLDYKQQLRNIEGIWAVKGL